MTPRDSSYRLDFISFIHLPPCSKGDILAEIVIKITGVRKLSDLASINSYLTLILPITVLECKELGIYDHFEQWISNITSSSLLCLPLIGYYRSIICIAIAKSSPLLLQQTSQLQRHATDLWEFILGEKLITPWCKISCLHWDRIKEPTFPCYFHHILKPA